MGLISRYIPLNIIEIITPKTNIFAETRTQVSLGLWPSFPHSLRSKQFYSLRLNSVVLGFRATKTIFTKTRHRAVFRRCLCSYCLLVEADSFGLCDGLLTNLVCKIQELLSLGFQPRDSLFSEFVPFWNLCLVLRNKRAKFGLNTFISSRGIREQYTRSLFYTCE